MFTTFDKALAGVLMGGLFILNTVFGINLGFSEGTIGTIVGVLTPVIIYFVPNRT